MAEFEQDYQEATDYANYDGAEDDNVTFWQMFWENHNWTLQTDDPSHRNFYSIDDDSDSYGESANGAVVPAADRLWWMVLCVLAGLLVVVFRLVAE